MIRVYTLSFSHKEWIGKEQVNVYKFVPVDLYQLDSIDFRSTVPDNKQFKEDHEVIIQGMGMRLVKPHGNELVRELTNNEREKMYEKRRGGQ